MCTKAKLMHATVIAICVFLLPSEGFGQANFAQFADCIGYNTGSFGSTCTLPYSATPYQIDPSAGSYSSTSGPPLQVFRNNIVVNGGGSWPNVPTILRGTNGGGTAFKLFNITGSGITLQNFIVDGNRFNLSGLTCLTNTDGWIDVDGLSAPHLKVQYMRLTSAPGIGLTLPQTTTTSPADVYVYNSWFEYSRHVNILAQDYNVVDYNSIYYSGINGVQTYHGGNQLIEYNTFYQNHDEWWTQTTGGQLIIYDTAPNVNVIDNYFDGGNALCPSTGCSPHGCSVNIGSRIGTGGIEHYAANGTFTNNEIKNHVDQGGIGGTALNGITVDGTFDPGWTPGWIHDNGAGLAFQGTPSGTWTFTNLQSIHNLNGGPQVGVWAPGSGTTINWGSGACLTGNSSPYNLGSGWTTPPSTSYNCR